MVGCYYKAEKEAKRESKTAVLLYESVRLLLTAVIVSATISQALGQTNMV